MPTVPPTADPPGESHHHGSDADCADAVAEIYGFLDGELDDDAMVQIETHLRRCSPCLEAFDFEVELRRMVVTRCTEQIPPDLRDRFCEMLRELGPEGPDVPGVPTEPGPS